MRRLLAHALAASLVFGAAPAALAQPKDAVTHFEAGRKLRAQGDIAKAIDEFTKSDQAEPNVGARFNLGACYEMQGEYRKALDSYHDAAKLAYDKHDPRENDAYAAIAQLRKSRSWVLLRLGPAVLDLHGLKVTIDDVEVPRKEFNGEVFRDARPTHTVAVTANDREPFRSPVDDHADIEIKLENLKPIPRATGPVVPPPPPPGGEEKRGGWGWPQWVGLGAIVGGAGLAAYGAYRFGDIQVRRNDAKDAELQCEQGKGDGCTGDTKQATIARHLADYNGPSKDHQREIVIAYGISSLVLIAGGIVLLAAGSAITGESASASPTKGHHVTVTPVFAFSGPSETGETGETGETSETGETARPAAIPLPRGLLVTGTF